MGFAHPSYLWALIGLLIPIAIHLLSRKEGKVIRVGSIRHFEESNTSQFKSLRLNEVLLLALRCLMVSMLALFLSGAQCSNPDANTADKWVVLEPGVENNAAVKHAIDSLDDEGYSTRWLSHGFPSTDNQPSTEKADYRRLTGELTATGNEAIIFAFGRAQQFAGLRAPLAPTIRWINVDPQPQEFQALATKVAGDSVLVRMGHSTTAITEFTSRFEKGSASSLADPAVDALILRLSVVADQAHLAHKNIVEASIRSLQHELGWKIESTNPEWIIWLSSKQPEIPQGAKAIIITDEPSSELIHRADVSRWQISSRLAIDVAAREHLAAQLYELFQTTPVEVEMQLAENDARQLPEAMAWSVAAPGAAVSDKQMADISKWLIAIFVLCWGFERWVATSRNL